MNLKAAMQGNAFLLAALFLFLLLVAASHSRYNRPGSRLVVGGAALTFGLFLFFTGVAAKMAIAGMPASARASLGYGFWLILLGLMLILWQSSNKSRYQAAVLGICLLVVAALYLTGTLSAISLFRELSDKSDRMLGEILRHMQLTLSAVMTGLVLSLLLSYGAYRKAWVERLVAAIANFAQVVPTLSLLGLLMIPLAILAARNPFLKDMGISGIGFFPAYIVLTLYTLLPITSSTIAGFQTIAPSIIEAASGMGMTRRQMLVRIELPMAFPAIYAGFRTALVQTVGNCILAGLVGGGGLGAMLFLGLAQSAPDLVIVTSLLVVSIAVVLDAGLKSMEEMLRKRWRGELTYD